MNQLVNGLLDGLTLSQIQLIDRKPAIGVRFRLSWVESVNGVRLR